MKAAFLVALLSAAMGEQLQLELPIQGWTRSADTQVVVTHLRPDLPVDLYWLGWKWVLWPNQAGRAGAYLPVLPRRNIFEVEQPGRGRSAVQLLGTGEGPDLVVAAAWDPGARPRASARARASGSAPGPSVLPGIAIASPVRGQSHRRGHAAAAEPRGAARGAGQPERRQP